MKIFSTREAAEYLGVAVSTLKYHVYHSHITPQKVGHSLVFTKAQLDDFEATRRNPGRPRKSG